MEELLDEAVRSSEGGRPRDNGIAIDERLREDALNEASGGPPPTDEEQQSRENKRRQHRDRIKDEQKYQTELKKRMRKGRRALRILGPVGSAVGFLLFLPEAAQAYEEGTLDEELIDQSPIGDAKTIVEDGPEVVSATKETVEIMERESQREQRLNQELKEYRVNNIDSLLDDPKPLTAGSLLPRAYASKSAVCSTFRR